MEPLTEVQWGRLRAPQLRALALVPVGSIEQHGPHLLALEPSLVDEAALGNLDPPADGLGAAGGVYRYRPIADYTDSGVIGRPRAATAEKGERLLDAAAEALCERLLDGATWS